MHGEVAQKEMDHKENEREKGGKEGMVYAWCILDGCVEKGERGSTGEVHDCLICSE